MAKPKVFFRVDANSTIGMGHFIRCIALAEMLEDNFEITFLIIHTPNTLVEKYLYKKFKGERLLAEDAVLKKVSKNEILVLDGYSFDSVYQKKIKEAGIKLVYLDDLKSFEYSADVIINQAEGVERSDYKTQITTIFCLGPQYALLRKEFLAAAINPKPEINNIQSVFISFGGADADNVTLKVLKVLCEFSALKNIHVLTGSVNENVKNWKETFNGDTRITFHSDLSSSEVCSLMQSCQLALCPASSLSLEVCAAGLVLLTGTTAQNQIGYYEALIKNSAAMGIGEWQKVSEQDLHDKLIGILCYDKKGIDFFISNQKAYIDGKSGHRLLNVFLELAK